VVKISSLQKTLGSFFLSIDHLEIPSPGIYGLMGPNGSGKSTLVKLLCGILQPDSGTIDTGLPSRDITLVTQKPYIMTGTVLNNLSYPLKIRGIQNSNDLCNKYLEQAGFLKRKEKQARSLSGGEKQKLALIRAMIFMPKLIMLDEAMTDLDLDSLDMFEEMVLEQQRKNPAIWIIISHQTAHIKKLCDHVFFIVNGKILANGTTEEILHSDNTTVRRYLRKL